MIRPLRLLLAAAVLAAPVASPAQQMSESYDFLKAVRDEDGTKVTQMLDKPGASIVNTRDKDSGDTALHIVVKRGDNTYLSFLLSRGANANAQDARGNTPLLLAVNGGCGACIDTLVARKANLNLANASGETPLIRAVQLRNLDFARTLLTAGANPDQADRVAGMTARDYAKVDNRSPAITKLLNDAPKTAKRAVSGPKL
ncbi:ankyrin repeat domain-containing protein [Sphingomonas donggukensis]|uniref:Ankyrin repeat domain-containing protein n=1 Tax=Sphingomonas donggukensis TaxID=2949093 RepID=A0ABY4TSK1_9SPHN|nr:ankyrin repeat domain-containing protein [Sphingomonas donggukensis]URW75262.1 ankyrin repeat domain-containing protein [Sphingomonas donggukensis]